MLWQIVIAGGNIFILIIVLHGFFFLSRMRIMRQPVCFYMLSGTKVIILLALIVFAEFITKGSHF